MEANRLRAEFTRFFADRDHTVVPSASLIPHHPRAPLFTNAGMNQFISYYLGEEQAPFPRATSVQRCVRIRGKHDDIELIGRTSRHLTFFEMLGNFSFGDYFKAGAIPFAWDLLTGTLGLEPDRLWVTVHDDDDEAAAIWLDVAGLPGERLQRAGEDNFWEMGDTGPCGPSSEVYYDRQPGSDPAGGPVGGDEERFVELWNLVFLQYDRQPDGSLAPLPRPSIDTGAGLERALAIAGDLPSVWETDALRPMIDAAEEATGKRYGTDPETDVALRVLGDHGRAMSMLIADGVLPANDGRGYVLRRVIRRAVLAARRLGMETVVTPRLAERAAEQLGDTYPKIRSDLDLVCGVLEREESGFDRTLRAGLAMLDEAIAETGGTYGSAGASGAPAEVPTLPGDVVFRLHDTHGFPVELTEELARESGLAVDRSGFEAAMAEQRERARRAARVPGAAGEDAYRALLEREGPTDFVGRSADRYSVPARVTAVMAGAEPGTAEVFLDRTPFYAEGGGQVGDTGAIVTESGRADVYDTVVAFPGLTAHRVRVTGELFAGQDALATIDAPRREAVRRNHTGTHLLHAALRQVLGDHARQQGSLVAPDHLRFDFSHHAALAPEELAAVVHLVNVDVLTDAAVETSEVDRREAEEMGAVAFFGEKYGDRVRVVRAGPHSLELCGGTHVTALGQIGPLGVVSEASIGSNTRRIEAVTGMAAIERSSRRDALLDQAALLLRTEPTGVVEALERLVERQRAADRELQRLRRSAIDAEAAELAAQVADGWIVARRDGRTTDELRSLAQSVQRRSGARAVVLGGSPEGSKAAFAVATAGDPDAATLVKRVAARVGGGGGGSAELAVAGGRQPGEIDEALAEARRTLGEA